MKVKRTYSAADVAHLVEFVRASGDFSEAELAGMEKLAEILKRYENMTDGEIMEEVEQLVR